MAEMGHGLPRPSPVGEDSSGFSQRTFAEDGQAGEMRRIPDVPVLDPELEGSTQAVIQGSRERRPLMPLGRPMPMIGNSTE